MPISFPFLVTVSADPVPGATDYDFSLNGVTSGANTAPTKDVSVPTAGTHVFGVKARSAFDTSTEGFATVQIQSVGQPGNIKIVKK